MKTTTIRLYSLDYSNVKTYFAAALFILGNLVLPQLCHLIPQGGLTLLPIYFFTLIAAYKYGWKVGLLTAVFSPVLNHLLFGMPPAGVLSAILLKSILLAVVAGYAANRFKRISIPVLALVVLAYQFIGTLGEWAMVGNLALAFQDFRIGIPGMGLQILGGYLFIKYLVYSMLRKIRLTFAIFFFVLITLLFLDFTGTLHAWFGWMAKIQFLPALLALNIGVVIILIALTLLFGRVYCSVICPLGVFQDVVSWLGKKRKKNRYSYSPALSWLRYGVLGVFILALIGGVGSLVALLAPYSSYGRIVSNLFAPVYQWGNNLLALLVERADSYMFYSVDVWMKAMGTFVIAVLTFVILAVLAWRNGRTYCNTICPVGTVLGFFSRFSLLKPVIDTSKCNGCGLCARNCKAACIDSKNHKIDYSRCVACMDCIGKCKKGAIRYERPHKEVQKPLAAEKVTGVSPEQVDNARRAFFSAGAVFAASTLLKAQEKKVDGGLAVIEDKKIPERTTPIVPAGSLSIRNFAQHCTACQLCVSVCPNQVLRPSGNLMTLMQPEMSYERGYCRPECAKCAEVCPTDAIHLTSLADKSSIQIGHAVWIRKNCVPLTDGVNCGNCARHCPVAAIEMVPSEVDNPDSPKIPVVNVERCIGCGACENLCPARPFSAIYVEGHERHRVI